MYNLQGITNKILGNKNEAVVSFKKAIKNNSKNADVYNNLGLTYIDLKKFDQAIPNFKKSIIYFEMGMSYFLINKSEKALQNLNLALKNDPKNVFFRITIFLIFEDAII